MSDYDANARRSRRSPGSWLAGLVIAVLVIVAIGYALNDRLSTNTGLTEHRASATDTAPLVSRLPPSSPAKP